MRLDAAHFPLVWIRLTPQMPATADFSALETLLARQEDFVLLNDEGLELPAHRPASEAVPQAWHWMKRHRHALCALVKAAVFIEPSTARRLATYAFTSAFERAWGYPMHLVATEGDALALAQQLLQDRPTDAILEFL